MGLSEAQLWYLRVRCWKPIVGSVEKAPGVTGQVLGQSWQNRGTNPLNSIAFGQFPPSMVSQYV